MQQEVAHGKNNHSDRDEGEYAEDADTLALKFGETECFGLKFLLRHEKNSDIIRRR